MEQFEAILSGTDSTIDGIAQGITYPNFTNAYEFKSTDGTLHLIIAKDAEGQWIRLTGTEPFLSSWIDELAEQVESTL